MPAPPAVPPGVFAEASPFDVAGVRGAGDPAAPAAPAAPAQTPGQFTEVHTDDAKYFVITSNTKENVVKSVKHSLWATQRKNEQRLDEAFRTAPAVVLVFSVNRTDAFQGYACMRSPIGKPRARSADPFNGFGRLFDVEWLRLHDLPFGEVLNLRNPLNGDRPVTFSRDGQELTNDVGRRLCGLIDRHVTDPDSFPKAEPRAELADAPWKPPAAALAAPVGGGGAGALSAPWPPPPPKRGEPGGSSGSEAGGRRKRRRKWRHPPHPLFSDFDEQLGYFLDLDYEEYVKWYRRHGSKCPGPLPPPGCAPPGLPPMAGLLALPPAPVHAPPPHAALAHLVPVHGMPPPPALPPCGPPLHMGHPHMMPP